MLKNSKHSTGQGAAVRRRVGQLLLAVVVCLTAALWLVARQTQAGQRTPTFNAKADVYLQQVYEVFRRPANDGTARREETTLRQVLARSVRLERNGDATEVGVLLRLSEVSEGELAKAQKQLEERGFRFRTRIGNIAALQVNVEDLPRLAEEDVVLRLEAAKVARGRFEAKASKELLGKSAVLRAVNDAANAAVRGPEARANFNVTGKGVVVGVIDSGIDWEHADFRKADGTTRIKALWDVSDSAKTGPGGVGRTYTEAEINNALRGMGGVNEADTDNHGTHVTGTAAGNGLAAGNGVAAGMFAGLAPEADLVIVKAQRSDEAGFADDDQLAALAWIAERATALNEPFVINMSLGGHGSQHDGTEAVEVAIDNLLAAGPGRQVVIAAGNEGEDPIHFALNVPPNTPTTVPFAVSETAKGMLFIYSGRDAFSVTVTKPNGAKVGPLAFGGQVTNDPNIEFSNGEGAPGTNMRAVLIQFKQPIEGIWQLSFTGTTVVNGRIDIWSADDGLTAFNPNTADFLMHVGSPATSRRGIAVANYVTKTQFTNFNKTTTTLLNQGTVGQGAASSSAGPTRNGRLKPEIAAPGTYLLSALSVDIKKAPDPALVSPDGKHNAYFGTSMATPVTTGVIALMLQLNRNLSADQIKRLIVRTARADVFTGPSVTYKFGYGKLDAFAALKAVSDGIVAKEFISTSAASFAPELIAAPESIVAGFGTGLAGSTLSATTTPLPTTLGGVVVRVTDSAGVQRSAPLYFVSANQINYQIPLGTALGTAQIEVLRDNASVGRGSLNVNTVWPAFFTANASGTGVGAAVVLRVKANGQQLFESVANPIDLSIATDKVYLVLFGTGFRGRSALDKVKMTLGGTPLAVSFAGKQGGLVGVDQMNVELPNSLAGRGQLELVTYVDNWFVNTIQFTIK